MEPTDNALKALRKIEASTQVGVTREQYGSLIIEAKTQVNEANGSLPDGELKTELNQAVDAYADAGEVWDKQIFQGESELGQRLIAKYGVQPVTVVPIKGTTIYDPEMRKKIWLVAKQHTDRAASVIPK